MSAEYRVVWKTKNGSRKSKRYVTHAGVARFLAFLQGKAPEEDYNPDLGIPEIEYAHVEQHEVGPWEQVKP